MQQPQQQQQQIKCWNEMLKRTVLRANKRIWEYTKEFSYWTLNLYVHVIQDVFFSFIAKLSTFKRLNRFRMDALCVLCVMRCA